MSNRNAEFEFHQHAKNVDRRVRQIEAVDFFNLLTGPPALLAMTDAYLPEHREGCIRRRLLAYCGRNLRSFYFGYSGFITSPASGGNVMFSE